MGMTKTIIKAADAAKPVLKKVLPVSWLQQTKAKMLERSFNGLVAKGKQPFEREAYRDGVNLIGFVRAEFGLGQSCRLLANELEQTDIDYTLYDFKLPNALLRSEDHSMEDKISEEFPFNINIIHINPDENKLMYTQLDPSVWDKRYNIAFWLWELETIPKHWQQYFPLLDEIWTPSEFISKSLRKVSDLPVKTMPYYVTVPTEDIYDRAFFKLPEDAFLFLTMYDANSTSARKNPMGAIKAFQKVFSKFDTSVGLVIKINNCQEKDIEELGSYLKDYENIYYIKETLSKVQVNSLVKAVDVFVSLHRAEGFGLVMAEAMHLGTPVVATDWSSNTEFMDHKCACMVDYTFTTLKKDAPPYKKGATWAEPNIASAAKYMKRLYSDREYYEKKQKLAKLYVCDKLSVDNSAKKMEARINEIYNTKGN